MNKQENKNERKISRFEEFDEFHRSASEHEDEDDKIEEEEVYDWDLFRSFPIKTKTGSSASHKFHERALKFIKCITYILLFMLVLGGGVLTKITILFMVSQLRYKEPVSYCDYNEPEERSGVRYLLAVVAEEGRLTWYWCILFAFCIPELISLINSIHFLLFKKKKYPAIFDIFFVCFIDGIHVVALSILFLVAIPEYNSIEAVTIASSSLFIPTLLGIFSRNKQLGSSFNFIFMIVGDTIMLMLQVGVILTFSLFSTNISSVTRWILPIALIISSCRWWPNYVSSSSKVGFIRFLWRLRERLESSRGIVQGITALWRMLIFFVMSIIIINWQGIVIDKYFQSFPGKSSYNVELFEINNKANEATKYKSIGNIHANSVSLFFFLSINAVASFSAYAASKFSSQTLMQHIGFALPSVLTIPTTIAVILVFNILRWKNTCALHNFIPDYASFNSPKNLDNIGGLLTEWQYWIWIFQLLSQVWTTIHIWKSHCERLATADRIFAVPSYDSLIVDQALMLNKRRDEKSDDIQYIKDSQSSEEPKNSAHITDNSSNIIRPSDRVTKVYACATMWHELDEEMSLFMNSILRLDLCQGAMRYTQENYDIHINDYFELETHIFFDDAFQCMHNCDGPCVHDEDETHVNDYVKSLIETIKTCVERMGILALPPTKYPAPYGGRLEWLLPGKTRLIVHLKDKNKIRHRKRWSQVMYMYYLLGYRLIGQQIHISRKATIAENTYILTLDGDIDFTPTAVKVLLHLMKRDKELGAACGRIHPIGSGPMVWFQKFEYAIGHWLQKPTEHTIGSVLCSPGCFSLFRAKALMEDNVMRKYATRSSDARHYIQYDQGEDRWLCTLILQSGYRVEYSAASDSYTHAPETFNEFYNQRRRWIPSTIANIFDLLNTSKETRKVNENISWLYIAYQWALMGSTILGPGTIFLMLIGALVAAFRIGNWTSLYFNIFPIAIFIIVCFSCKARIQLIVAAIVSAFYGLVMIVVLVGIMIQITEDGWVAPSTILFCVVAFQIVITGLLHPQEWSCLLCGVIYYVTVPSMYMLLIIYSIFNIHDVTWGTRESRIPFRQKIGFEVNEDETVKTSNKTGINSTKGSIDFSLAGLFRCMLCTQNLPSDELTKLETIAQSLNHISSRLDTLEKNIDVNESHSTTEYKDEESTAASSKLNTDEEYNKETDDKLIVNSDTSSVSNNGESNEQTSGNFLVNPHWIHDPDIRKGRTEFLSRYEEDFWKNLIKKYLYPLDEDKKKLEKMEEALKKLRNENIFKFFMLNALFVLTVLLMQLNKKTLHFEWPLGATFNITYNQNERSVHIDKNYLELEPIGCLFISGFLAILCIQFVAMLFHRYNTFLHLLSNTPLKFNCWTKPKDISEDELLVKHTKDILDGLQRLAEENGIPDSKHGRLSTIGSPKKRNTVHELIENHDKRTRAPTNFDAVFRRNLTKSSVNPRLMSTGISENMLAALHRRRTIVAQQRDTKLQSNDSATNSQNNYHIDSRKNGNHNEESNYAFNNRGFINGENNDVENGTLSHRHSQVKFSD